VLNLIVFLILFYSVQRHCPAL